MWRVFVAYFVRFISVGTENTIKSKLRISVRTVHLRGYGEHQFIDADAVIVDGSSPWVRRTRGRMPSV